MEETHPQMTQMNADKNLKNTLKIEFVIFILSVFVCVICG